MTYNARYFFIILFSLLIFTSLHAKERPDNIAVDKTAQYWRSLDIDPAIEKVPSYLLKGVRTDPQKYVSQLVKHFQSIAGDDYHLVKLFHDWITYHIAYDTDKFNGWGTGSSSPYELCKINRTTCGGFSALFLEMCDLSGIEAIKISGYSRNYTTSGHAWNAVKLNGKWYIVDTTSDNRFGFKNKKFSEKQKYSNTSLFIRPEAKLMINFPYDVKEALTEHPGTEEDFRARPLLNMAILDYPGIRFLNLEKYRSKYPYTEPGTKHVREYDIIKPHNGVITLELTCPPNILLSSSLYDEEGKRYNMHTISYTKNGKTYIQYSLPDSGMFKGSIQARYLDCEDRKHTIYSFKVLSEKGAGPAVPAPGKLTWNQRLQHEGIKILDHNLERWQEDGFLRIHVLHSPLTSLYASLYDSKDVKYNKNIFIDKGVSNRIYYITLPRKELLQWRLYSKPKAQTDQYHQQTATLNIQSSQASPLSTAPPLKLIRYDTFNELGCRLIDSDLESSKNPVYTVKVKAGAGVKLQCRLKDAEGKNVEGHYAFHREGDVYTFTFSTPDKKGIYSARMYYLKDVGYASIAYFQIHSPGGVYPHVPLSDTLYTQNYSDPDSTHILEHNLSTARKDGYYRFSLPLLDEVEYYTGLYDLKGKTHNKQISTSFEKDKKVYYIVPPDKGYYYIKIYMKNPSRDKNFNKTIAVFATRDFVKRFEPLQPPLIAMTKQHFFDTGCTLLSSSLENSTDPIYTVKIKVLPGVTLSSMLKDKDNKNVAGHYVYHKEGDVYTFSFSQPRKKGDYSARIYSIDEGKYSQILTFSLVSKGGDFPTLPLPDRLYTQESANNSPFQIQEYNFDQAKKQGYYRLTIGLQSDVAYYLKLYDLKGNSYNKNISSSIEGTQKVYYFIPPANTECQATLYMKHPSRDKSYNKVLYRFATPFFPQKYKTAQPAYVAFYREAFSEIGLKLISADLDKMISQGACTFKIQVPQGYELTCNIKDEKNNYMKEYYSKKNTVNTWTLSFKRPPGGPYTASIYARKTGDKSARSVLYFIIE